MNRLLTSLGVILFATLIQGFADLNNTINEIKCGHGITASSAKWQNTAWVNPWIDLQKADKNNESVGPAIVYWNWDANPFPPPATYFKIYIDGTLVIDRNTGDFGTLSVPSGSTVKVEVNVAHFGGSLTFRVDNVTTSEELWYSDHLVTVSFSFQVPGDHEYQIFADA